MKTKPRTTATRFLISCLFIGWATLAFSQANVCTDGIDNDTDGLIDTADPDCDHGFPFTPGVSPCPGYYPVVGSAFDLIGAPAVSGQNTADTQSKVGVGDIDDDGIPDAIVTSKWASTLRVIATTNDQYDGSDAGDYKAVYNIAAKDFPSAAKNDPCDPTNLLFEHEVAIADIDGDGAGEIYTIVSNRGGNPESPPTCFYLAGFRYDKNLSPASKRLPLITGYPVSIGTDRPGIIGIADFNGDGLVEVYVRNKIYAAEDGSKLLADGGGNWDADIGSASTAVDMDHDGLAELVCGNLIYKVPNLTRGSTINLASNIWKDMNAIPALPAASKYYIKIYTDLVEYGTDTHSSTAVADMDNDNNIDVVLSGAIGSNTGQTAVFYWNVTKQTVSTYSALDAGYPSGWPWGTSRVNLMDSDRDPANPDPVRDGYVNVNFIAGNQLFSLMTVDGPGGTHTVLAPAWTTSRTINDSRSGIIPVTCYDFENDGDVEIVYRDSQELVVVDGKTGQTKHWSAPCNSHTFSEGPIIADVNDDGATDICVPCYRNTAGVAGQISSITVTAGGTGYVQASTAVAITGGGGGGATATANVTAGVVTSITIVDPGASYTSIPTVTINGVGTGATATATISTNGFDVNGGLQQQALGELRLFFSSGNEWIPTRQVWNQPGYFVVNVNDNLTIPKTQFDPNYIFSNAPCPNGIPGPVKPLNMFLNQVPTLGANGCPEFPAPNLAFFGDTPSDFCTANPTDPTCDSDGDGVYTPTVEIIPPVCGNIDINAAFNIENNGNLALSDMVAVSFFSGDPRLPGATKLYNTTINITNLGINETLRYPAAPGTYLSFNGPAFQYTLFVVLYNDGSTYTDATPLVLSGYSDDECSISDNIYSTTITPTPFTVTIEKLSDNEQCGTGPPTGALRAHVFRNGVEVLDYSNFGFTWTNSSNTVIGTANGSAFSVTGLPDDTYFVVVQDIVNNCQNPSVSEVIVATNPTPDLQITEIIDQTTCSPANGKITANITGGNIGYTFEWFDSNNNPINISSNIADGLPAGNYTVVATKNGCPFQLPNPATVNPPLFPDVFPTAVDIFDCANPTAGEVSASVQIAGVPKDTTQYSFAWFQYDNVNGMRGSPLPPAPWTGPTRKGLTVGYYEVVATDNATGCTTQKFLPDLAQIQSTAVIPDPPVIRQLAEQTSCDPLQPNGRLIADPYVAGVLQDSSQFSYTWYQGQQTTTPVPGGDVSGTNGRIVNNVAGGGTPYTVKVTTQFNCISTAEFTISELASKPIVTLTQLTPNSVCDPSIATNQYNGSLSASVTFNGNTIALPDSDFEFTFYDASNNPIGTPSANNVLSLQPDGNYSVTVERVGWFCVSDPDQEPILSAKLLPVIKTDTVANTFCTLVGGVGNGVANVLSVDNGAPLTDYNYLWSDDGTTTTPVAGNAGVNTSTISGLMGAFTYTVEVTSISSGCKNSDPAPVPNLSVIPVVQLVEDQPNSVCDITLGFNGRVEASFLVNSGALADYNYTWRNETDNIALGVTPPTNTGPGVTLNTEFGGLNGGKTYSVIATNPVNGCTSAKAQAPLTNQQLFPVIKTDTVANTFCTLVGGVGNGQAMVVNVDNGQPLGNYTYVWSDDGTTTTPVAGNPGVNTATIGSLFGGFIYTVTVRNTSTGCTNSDPAPVPDLSVIPVVQLLEEQPNSICDMTLGFNGRVGASYLVNSGTLSDYTYTWHNETDNIALGVTPPTNTGPGVTLNTQFGGLNGGKTYSVIATNPVNGCTSAKAQVPLTNQQLLPVIKTDTVTNTFCTLVGGVGNGQAMVVNVDNGQPLGNYTYLWSDDGTTTTPVAGNPGVNTATIGSLFGGFIYTVTVRNTSTGCTNSDPAPVPDLSVIPVVQLLEEQPNSICDMTLGFNGRVGASYLVNSGTLSDYTYTWHNETDNVALGVTPPTNTGPGVTLNTQFGGLNGGKTYSVIASNPVNGCTSAKAQVPLTNLQLLPVIKTDTVGSTFCTLVGGVGDGQASVVNVDNGQPLGNYTYVWSDNASTTDADGRTTSTITGLFGGFVYTVTVRNTATGCTNSDPAPLPDLSVIPVVQLVEDQPNSICDMTLGFNGRVEASFLVNSGVLANYTYTWRNETDNIALAPPTTSTGSNGPGGSSPLEYGTLNGGKTYSVIASNPVNGCTAAKAQVPLTNLQLLPVIKTDTVVNTFCTLVGGVGDGQASVTSVDNGQPLGNYTYVWSDNGSTPDADGRTTSTITGLFGGFIYTVTVRNTATGCTNSDPAPVPDLSVIPVVQLVEDQPNSICDLTLGFNGRVEASFSVNSGTLADYTYTWRNETDNIALAPPTTSTGSNGPGGATPLEYGTLNGGKTYSVIASNPVNGCTSAKAQAPLTNLQLFPVIKTDSIPSTNCDVLLSNGSIVVTTVDGVNIPNANYTFVWSDDGLTNTTVAGQTTEDVTSIQGGFQYTVEARNVATGCENTHSVSLPDQQQKPIISLTKIQENLNCDPGLGSTGIIHAFVTYNSVSQNTPDTPPGDDLPANYTITWSAAGTGTDPDVLLGLPAGNYNASVEVTDLGCVSDPDSETILDTFVYPVITIDAALDINTGITDQTSCGAPNGAIDAKIETAIGTLEFQWYDGIGITGATIGGNVTAQASGTYTGIANEASADYTLWVRNESTGCEIIQSPFIPNNIDFPTLTLLNTNVVTICSPTPNGEAEATLADLSALPTVDYDLFYVYTFQGGTAPTDPLVVKASVDGQNVLGGSSLTPPTYVDMAPGFLTAIVVDNNTQCESAVVTVQVVDGTILNTITVNGVTNAALCGGIGGAIDISVAGGVGVQSYDWFAGTPTNATPINFFNNPPVMNPLDAVAGASGTVDGTAEDLGPPSAPAAGVGAGTYTVIIVDANGCGAYFVQNIAFTNPPAYTVTETDNDKCVAPLTGDITVDITAGTSILGYTIEIFSGNNASGALQASVAATTAPVSLSAPALPSGQYFVQVRDTDGANIACPLGSGHTLEQLAFPPLVSINSITENTACNTTVNGDGEVDLTATPHTQQSLAMAFPDFQVTTINPLPVGFALTDLIEDVITGVGTLAAPIGGFGGGVHTITVTDVNSGCFTDASVPIPDQPVLPEIFQVEAIDESFCAPTSNGSISVTSIGVGAPEPVTNFHFEWYSNSDVTVPANLIYNEDGGAGNFGETFNSVDAAWSIGGTAGAGNGNRQYFVRARRIAGVGGIGCYTQLEQKDVIDLHRTPNLTLTPFANTSCLVAGEGVIRAVTDIQDDVRVPSAGPQAGTYTYTWNPDPAGGNTSGVDGIGIARLANFDITSLDDNGGVAYSVSTINSTTGCSTSGTAIIPTIALPFSIIDYTTVDQLKCDPDGNITVTQIRIDASGTTAAKVFDFPVPDGVLNANFDFQWFNAADDGDNDPNTFDDTMPLLDGGGVPTAIVGDVLTGTITPTAGEYPTMGAGTYYVIATRKPGMFPGSGCESAPVRVNLIQDVNYPTITSIQAFANTSCELATTEGRIEITVNTASGVPAESGSTYTYEWQSVINDPVNNPAGQVTTDPGEAATFTIPPTYLPPPAVLALADALKEDTYNITITNEYSGCSIPAQAIVTPTKYPVTLVNTTKQDQLICGPDGRITVEEVTIDASTNGLGVFTFTSGGFAGEFEFDWFDANNDGDNNPSTFDPLGPQLQDAGAVDIIDEVLSEDVAETTQPFPTMGAGSYYIVATRSSGVSPGAGCSTAPVRVNIDFQPNYPVVNTLNAFSNTSCEAGTVEGRIELAVSTASGVPAESGSTYTYTWESVINDPVNNPGGQLTTLNGEANTLTIPPTYSPPPAVLALADALKEDTYNITITNEYSGCSIPAQGIVTKQQYPVTLVNTSKQDQLICGPDGRITVLGVTIDASTHGLPVYTFPADGPLPANFTFAWFDSNNDGDSNPATFDPLGTVLLDAANNPITDVVLSEDGAETTQPFPTMGAGSYYVVATRTPGLTPGAGCSTAPVRVNIDFQPKYPVVNTLNAFSNTSCEAGTTEGRIELAVSTTSGVPAESGSTYTYTWQSVINDPVNNPAGQLTTLNGEASALTIPPTYAPPPAVLALADALKDDTYNITITNEYSGCSIPAQGIVTKQQYPVTLVNTSKQDQLICGPDGRITVEGVTIDATSQGLPIYSFPTDGALAANFTFSWFDANNDGDGNPATFNSAGPFILDASANPVSGIVLSEDPAEAGGAGLEYPTMGEGSYYVMATRLTGLTPGAGCKTAPVRVNIDFQPKYPVINTLNAFSNTSCEAGTTEGRIELAVSTASGVPAESGSTYSYTWQSVINDPVNNPAGQLTTLNTQASSLTIPPTYAPPPAVLALADALKDDTYNITITNEYSGCSIPAQGIVTKQQYPVTLVNTSKQDQLICGPDGRITVEGVTIDASTQGLPVYNFPADGALAANFTFSWFDANNDADGNPATFNPAGPFILDASANPVSGIVLSEDPAEAGGAGLEYPTMGAGSYYVMATRLTGLTPGAGCSTAPVRVNIDFLPNYPVINSIQAFANTSCELGTTEGRIELSVSTASGVGAESGSTYSYTWQSAVNDPVNNPAGQLTTTNGQASTFTIPPTYALPPPTLADALKDDTYNITITNDYSGCSVPGQAIVTPTQYPLTLISYTKQDQLICFADGNITVTEVTIDATTSNNGVFNYNTQALLLNNFDFEWYDADNDSDGNPATFSNNPALALVDAANNPIIDVVLSEDGAVTTQPYTTMGAGTYYVVAKRQTGLIPGAGCRTAPVRVDIQDLSTDPEISFTSIPNSSCNTTYNGSITTVVTELDGSVGTYDYSWTFNTAPMGLPPTTSQLTAAQEGDYTATALNTTTGCTITGPYVLQFDQNRSKPNVIEVVTVDPLDCNPSASAQVTKITIGSTTSSILIPPSNEVTDPVMLADPTLFTYTWLDPSGANMGVTGPTIAPNAPGLAPGTYQVIVQDETTDCQSDGREVVINDDDIIYPDVVIAQTKLQVSCDLANPVGELVASARTGNGAYLQEPDFTFTWYNSIDNTAGTEAGITVSTYSNLGAGNYSVTALDVVSNCTANEFFIVPDDSPLGYPELSVGGLDRTSCAINNGSVQTRVTNMSTTAIPNPQYPFAAYSFTPELFMGTDATGVSLNPYLDNPTANPPGNYLNAAVDSGNYFIRVTDNNTTCVTTALYHVNANLVYPEILITEDQALNNCLNPNGQLSAIVTNCATCANGVTIVGYTFDWYLGPQPLASPPGAPYVANNPKLIGQGLNNGLGYIVNVTNNETQCMSNELALITDDRASQTPFTPVIDIISHVTKCDPLPPNGWLHVRVEGDNDDSDTGYRFDWYNGSTATGTPVFNGFDYYNLAGALDPGTPYTVTATNLISGCISPAATVSVLIKTIIPELKLTSTPSYCADTGKPGIGSVQVEITNFENQVDGEKRYVIMEKADWTSQVTNSPAGSGAAVYDLYPGVYSVSLTSTDGCVATGEVKIETEIFRFNGVSNNNDGANDAFIIDCISEFPNNNVKIFNRSGILVFEADGYNNLDVAFKGIGENGLYLAGIDLPEGTYFYIIDKRNGDKPVAGYLELER